MSNESTFSGASLDEALTNACASLRARVGELHYEIIEGEGEDEAGIMINAEVDPVAVVGLFLAETCAAGSLEVKAYLEDSGEVLEGELSGVDLRLLTASGGRGLDALQYICNRVLNRRMSNHPPVHLDSDGFKERRAHQLQEKAMDAAEEAIRHSRPVSIGPLTPAARREIHLALAEDPDVETMSDGEGFLKRIVIRPQRRG